MSNMSYCRFENTLHDLLDCQENLFDENGNTPADLSKTEKRARERLIEVCKQIAQDFQDQDEEDDSRNTYGDRNTEREEV